MKGETTMREITKATKNFTKKMVINSRNGIPMQDNVGNIMVVAAAVMTDTDEETGEPKDVGVIVTSDKTFMTCISATIIDTLPDLIDIVDEEGETEVRIDKRKSKGGRDFLTLTIY